MATNNLKSFFKIRFSKNSIITQMFVSIAKTKGVVYYKQMFFGQNFGKH